MKVQLTFKTPDVFDTVNVESMTLQEQRDLEDLATRWIEWGEYLTVEIDIDKETCKVVRRGR